MRIISGSFDDLVEARIRELQVRQRIPEHGPSERASPGPVITLSREFGSGGHTVAAAVSEQLGWSVWDRQLVDAIAQSAHERTTVVKSVDEHVRSEILAMLHQLIGYRMEESAYRRHLGEVILTVAQHGRAIIVGRGANYLVPHAMNVRIVAPLAYRARVIAEREGISREEAERRCHEVDRERADFVRSFFDRDIRNPLDYELVVNTGQLGVPGSVAAIVAATRERYGDSL